MKKMLRLILNALGYLTASAVGLAWFAILIASFPLSVLAVINYTGLEWWWAIVATVVGLMLPIIGQIGFIVATVYGGYILFVNDFDFERAAYGYPHAVSETVRKETLEDLKRSDMSKKDRFSQIFKASLTYYGAASVCGDDETIGVAKGIVRRVTRMGNDENIISVSPEQVLSATDDKINANREHFQNSRNLSCGEVSYWVSQLDSMTENMR